MNSIVAKITDIQKSDMLHVVKFSHKDLELSMMSLDLSLDIKVGKEVKLITKPSHVAIAKEFDGNISYSNQLPCTITSIENGELLSSIELTFFNTTIESIITLSSTKRLNLHVGDRVTAFIKASELYIGEVIC